MVTECDIKTNHEKVEVIQKMSSPRNMWEVEHLVGHVTALSHFISCSADQNLPFFKILWKATCFQWDEHCEKGFQKLKDYLVQLPILAKPTSQEKLWVYLSVSEVAVSTIVV